MQKDESSSYNCKSIEKLEQDAIGGDVVGWWKVHDPQCLMVTHIGL